MSHLYKSCLSPACFFYRSLTATNESDESLTLSQWCVPVSVLKVVNIDRSSFCSLLKNLMSMIKNDGESSSEVQKEKERERVLRLSGLQKL